MGPLRGDCVPAVPLSLWVLHTRYCWLDGNGGYMINVSPWGATGTGAGPCTGLGKSGVHDHYCRPAARTPDGRSLFGCCRSVAVGCVPAIADAHGADRCEAVLLGSLRALAAGYLER